MRILENITNKIAGRAILFAYGPIDRACRAYAPALTAANAFSAVDVIQNLDLHIAVDFAFHAVNTCTPIHFHLKHAKAVKKRIYRA